MARASYLGIGDKARKVKKIYMGIGDKARKVKKVYVGDANGKARLCWSAEANVYVGTFTTTSTTMKKTFSDLKFKPKGIMIIKTDYGLVVPDIITASSANGALYYYTNADGFTKITNDFWKVTFNSNSVIVESKANDGWNARFNGTYQYAIWGDE